MIEKVGGNLLGIVLNNINVSQDEITITTALLLRLLLQGRIRRSGKRKKRRPTGKEQGGIKSNSMWLYYTLLALTRMIWKGWISAGIVRSAAAWSGCGTDHLPQPPGMMKFASATSNQLA
jgi:hypothetical protein